MLNQMLFDLQASSNPFGGEVYNLLPFFCQFFGNETEQVRKKIHRHQRTLTVGGGGEAVETKLVKLKTRCTVILPPLSDLCKLFAANYRKF